MKYKLIKEYPGSPKLGTTVERDSNCSNYYYRVISGVVNTFTPKNIENHPEFWEEIIEKDYEILSLIEGKFIYPCDKYSKDYIHQLVNTIGANIHSVKRLSDGEIFTIGDKINNGSVITGIKHFKDRLNIWLDLSGKSCYGGYFTIDDIIKDKQPLFTTEDGVDIFEGDNYFKVLQESFILLDMKNANDNHRKDATTFSTKEKAEEYILINKPCLSYNEVLNATKIRNKNTFETLKDLVKSKIQQSV